MSDQAIKEHLTRISELGERTDGTDTVIYRPAPTQRHASGYLAGFPYLWTAFVERAFVFRDRKQAEELIAEFPDALKGCEARSMN